MPGTLDPISTAEAVGLLTGTVSPLRAAASSGRLKKTLDRGMRAVRE